MLTSSCDAFELKLTSEVESLWVQLGIAETEREAQVKSLLAAMQTVYSDFTTNLRQNVHKTREEILSIQDKHSKAMRAFGLSESDIRDQISPIEDNDLLEQLKVTETAFNGFHVHISDRLRKIENLIRMANESFTALGVPDDARGEFSDLGDIDFTRERVERFKLKIGELNAEKATRAAQFKEIRKSITDILSEVGESMSQEDTATMASKSLSLDHKQALESLKTRLEGMKAAKTVELKECAVMMIHLWDLLNVPQQDRSRFLSAHSTLSSTVLASCHAEIASLCERRDAKLPEFIAQQREEVRTLWEVLHVAEESRPVFKPTTDAAQAQVQEFEFLQAEIIRLKKQKLEMHPILDLISQREDIIRDYATTVQATHDPSRLMSRAKGHAQQLMQEEKARRRYKVALPRLDKKLYQMLREHKKRNSTDFEWDGKPYIENLSAEQCVDARPIRSKKVKGKKAGCQTLPVSPRRAMTENHNTNSHAAPNKTLSMRTTRAGSPVRVKP